MNESLLANPCAPARARAVVLRDFGGPGQFVIDTLPVPRRLADDEVLVRVRAGSVNPIDWKMREGLGLPQAFWRRKIGSPMVLGLDFAGKVVARGQAVTDLADGDPVIGTTHVAGAYREMLVLRRGQGNAAIARKPANVPYHVAALLPFAGLVAYAGLVDPDPRVPPPRRVLIVGASGGVGHLAVQIAKHALGAGTVVGVCSARNAGFVRQCGADEVHAYDRESLPAWLARHRDWRRSFDLIFDAAGDDRWWRVAAPRLLRCGGRFTTAAPPPSRDGVVGEDVGLVDGAALVARLAWRQALRRYRLVAALFGRLPVEDGFPRLVDWLARGLVVPHVAARFDLADIGAAHALSRTGRTVGKIGLDVWRGG